MNESKNVKFSITVNETIIYELVANITHDKIRKSVKEIENKLIKENVDEEKIKGIFGVSVEMLQNVMNYSSNDNGDNSSVDASFMICYNSDKNIFTMKTSNKVSLTRKETIEARINEIKDLDSKSLRKLMREKMRNQDTVHKNGAGLGFLMMAKKSNNNIEINFDEFVDDNCLFILKVKV